VELAKNSDVAVVVVGDDQHSSGEWGDRDSLDLPGGQLPLLEALAATGTPVVLVLITGRTATFGQDNAVLGDVAAILSGFRPGQMGGVAIANLLTGKAVPSGKLCQNWVRNAGQSRSGASPWLQWRVGKWVANTRGPADPDGRYYNQYNSGNTEAETADNGVSRADPLFRFGDGLSYTTFAISDLVVKVQTDNPEVPLLATLTLTNTGHVAGTEVVQLYVEDPVMRHVRPWKRLLAFQRVAVAAGGSAVVHIPVPADELAFYDDDMVQRVVPGQYTVSAATNSVDYDNTALVEIGDAV
jgi:beta-glucosidase